MPSFVEVLVHDHSATTARVFLAESLLGRETYRGLHANTNVGVALLRKLFVLGIVLAFAILLDASGGHVLRATVSSVVGQRSQAPPTGR